MASSYFLQLDGVDGQSVDKGHEKWIEVIDCSHGVLQNISIQRGTEVVGRGQFLPFTFTHAVDKATPKLQHFCMKGQRIPKAQFAYCQSIAGAQTPVYEITLEDVKVAKAEVKTVETGDVGGPLAQQLVEVVDLVAGKISWKVTPIKSDNTKEGAVEASFDQVANA
ncbi:MAG: type VI secretion system tube protein Hcp [Treponema sp.]|jgi:type VI secretion system Hcp family effector|nr:type VI secretion system tube protein Hcp [Treponema sp.]